MGPEAWQGSPGLQGSPGVRTAIGRIGGGLGVVFGAVSLAPNATAANPGKAETDRA